MEQIITVKCSIPDSVLQETIDDLDDDGSLVDETLTSLFEELINNWLGSNPYIHVSFRTEKVVV